MNKYLWSFEREKENWNYFEGSLEECLEWIKETNKNSDGKCWRVFIGDYKKYNPKQYFEEIDADDLINQVQCRSENSIWLDEIDKNDVEDLRLKMDDVFKQWLKDKHEEPNFGEAVNVKEYRI